MDELELKDAPEQIIIMQWKSPVMPVSAFDCFHVRCYTGQAERFPNGSIRYVPINEVSASAVCSGCSQYIRGEKSGE